ncbi:unnamed protein product, partial [Prorocentrum cordatum]
RAMLLVVCNLSASQGAASGCSLGAPRPQGPAMAVGAWTRGRADGPRPGGSHDGAPTAVAEAEARCALQQRQQESAPERAGGAGLGEGARVPGAERGQRGGLRRRGAAPRRRAAPLAPGAARAGGPGQRGRAPRRGAPGPRRRPAGRAGRAAARRLSARGGRAAAAARG